MTPNFSTLRYINFPTKKSTSLSISLHAHSTSQHKSCPFAHQTEISHATTSRANFFLIHPRIRITTRKRFLHSTHARSQRNTYTHLNREKMTFLGLRARNSATRALKRNKPRSCEAYANDVKRMHAHLCIRVLLLFERGRD